MRFTPTIIPQLFVLELEQHVDDRGFFARAWCQQELADHELATQCVQLNLAFNHRRGTLRGMHFQRAPYLEDKYVRMVQGAVHDVVIDLRKNSPAYGRWISMRLDAEKRQGLFIPSGCAHGYLTLTDNAEMLYMVSSHFRREAYGGLRWNSPALRGAWPFLPEVISDQDSHWPANLEEVSFDGPLRADVRLAG